MKSRLHVKLLLALLLALGLSGCTSQPVDYVHAYLQAQSASDGVTADDTAIEHFIQAYNDFADQVKNHTIGQLYAQRLYFSDTLTVLHSRAALVQTFRHHIDSLDAIHVHVMGYSQSGRNVFVRWKMTTRVHVWLSDHEVTTIGISQLRFNNRGQVIFQQDFWDSGRGVYDQLPVIGSLTRYIKSHL